MRAILLNKSKKLNLKLSAVGVMATIAILAFSTLSSSVTYATVPGVNDLVSIGTGGALADGSSSDISSISGDGQYIAFMSNATNLVASDTNSTSDIFVRDVQNGTTVRVSVSSAGVQSNSSSSWSSISYDGRYVVFSSNASNLVASDTNGSSDIFIRDLTNNTTELVSSTAAGVQGNGNSTQPSVSADGRFVVFTSYASNLSSSAYQYASNVFLKDRMNGTIKAVSMNTSNSALSNGGSSVPSISCDGNVVAFESAATNLVASDTNNVRDVFISVQGIGGPKLTNIGVSHGLSGATEKPEVSCDGNKVALRGPTNLGSSGICNLYVYDRLTQTFKEASLYLNGTCGNGDTDNITLSGDGRYVAFHSFDTNVSGSVVNAYQVYVRDMKTMTTERVSVASNLAMANKHANYAMISADGSYVTYTSSATNLVAADNNAYYDIYRSKTGY